MGLLVTSVQIAMGGLTHGNSPPNSPITGVATSTFPKWILNRTIGNTIQASDNADQPEESQVSLPGSGMEDTDSIIANVGAASAPSQTHQLAAVLWGILNNDRESNAAILEKLEYPGDDLSTNPVQVFTAADLAHLASDLAQTTHVLSQQAQHMAELSDIDDD